MKFLKLLLDIFKFVGRLILNTKFFRLGALIFPKNFREEFGWKWIGFFISTLGTWYVLNKSTDQLINLLGDLNLLALNIVGEEKSEILFQHLTPTIKHPENTFILSLGLQTPLLFILVLHSLRPGCTKKEVATVLWSLALIFFFGSSLVVGTIIMAWLTDLAMLHYLINKLFFHSHWNTLLAVGHALYTSSPFAVTKRFLIFFFCVLLFVRAHYAHPGYYEFDRTKEIDTGYLLLLELDVKTYFYRKRITQFFHYILVILFYLDMLFAGFGLLTSLLVALMVFFLTALVLARVSIKWIN